MVRNPSVSRPSSVAISAIKMTQRNLAAQPCACASSVSAAAELTATSAADNPGRIAENTQPRGEFIDGVRGPGRHDSVLGQVVAGDTRIRPISVQQYLQARHAFARIASG
jgi:hypothetical protein